MFPIYCKTVMENGIKKRYEIQLIKKNHTPAIETDKNEDDDPPINSLYTHGKGAENIDNYIQISRKQLKVYNNELKEKWTFSGLNIRNCVAIKQRYLYTLSDVLTEYKTCDESKGDSN